MALSANQINAIYAALFGPANLPSGAQLNTWLALDAAQGDNAVILDIVNSPASHQFDYAIVQLIQFVQGTVPTAAQLQGWVQYLEAGNSLASVVNAFAASTNFQNNFNNGNAVTNVNAPVNSTIAANIIFQALGTIPSQSQVQAWVDTHISIAQMVTDFALGDQYSARTAQFVQNYLVEIAAHAAGLPGAATPSGTLFGVPALITISDSTALNIPPEQTTAGSTVTFTVTGVGVSTGTTETWSLSGTALSEVTGPTSGTLTFNSAGQATIQVNTTFNNIASGTLTLSLTSVQGVTPDTVTVIAPAIQHFTSTVGETLTGGPANTVFIGTVDTQIVGNNTLSNVVDVAAGNAAFHNTEWITIDSTAVQPLGLNAETIVPASTGVQEFKFTNNDNFVFGPTQIDGSLMHDVNEISSFGSASNTNIFNLQNAITTINVSESDAPGQGFLGVHMINTTAPGFTQTINLTNAANLFLADETNNGTDVVGQFDINSIAGNNNLTIDGTSVATAIVVTDGGPSSVTGIHSVDDTEALTLVDMTGTSGTVTIGGIEASDGNALVINEGSGNDTEFVAVEGPGPESMFAGSLTINGTTTSGGSSTANVFLTNGGGQSVTDTQNNNNNNTLDVDNGNNSTRGANSTITATFGGGNNNASIDVGQASTVSVTSGNGNNTVSVDAWNTNVNGSNVNVTVGTGTNNVQVDTRENGSDSDTGSQVTINANAGNSANVQTIGVNVGIFATVNVTALGTGANSVTVNSDDLTANITVGDGDNTVTVNSDTVSVADQNPNTVTIVGGNGDNQVTVNGLPNGSVLTETLGSGSNTINDDVVLNSGPNAGGAKITVSAGLGVNDGDNTVNINLEGTGNIHANNVSVTTGTGDDSVSILNAVLADTVNVSTGAGNDRVFVNVLGSHTTLNGGTDGLSLVSSLNGSYTWAGGDTLATTAASFQDFAHVQQANIQGFENLELTTSVTDDINVLWMGPNNNIHKVVYDQGFNFGNSFVPQYLAGLNPGTEIDLLGPAGTSAQGDGDHNLAQNILRVPLNGANIFHTFAETLVLNPVAIETEGVGPDTENAYFGTIDFTAGLAGYSINQLNIDSLNTAEPFEGANDVTNHVNIFDPVAVNAGTLVLGGDQTLDLTGSGLGLFGFSHILADPFTGGLIDTDTIGGVGELDNGTTGITVNLPNAWSSTLNFGNQNDTVTLGNGNNTIQFGDGNDVYTAGNGNNHVSIGYGFEHGGVDNLSFGSGSNLVDLASHDTFANNGSGTAISFAAHTGNDTVAFHSIFNSDFGTPDTISGFQAATDTLSFDHTMLKNNSFNFDLVDVTSDAGAIAAASVDSSTHATFIYNTTTGHLFVDTDANHSITDGAHDMEITLVGIPAITTANIHIA